MISKHALLATAASAATLFLAGTHGSEDSSLAVSRRPKAQAQADFDGDGRDDAYAVQHDGVRRMFFGESVPIAGLWLS